MNRILLLCLLATVFPLMAENSGLSLSGRIVEKLVSRVPETQIEGERMLEKERGQIIADLITRLASSEPERVKTAAYELSILFSPWTQGQDAGTRHFGHTSIYSPRRPVERPNSIPEAPQLREALTQAFSRARENAEVNPSKSYSHVEAMRWLSSALVEFGDDQTAGWAIVELSKTKGGSIAEDLFVIVEKHMGIPPIYRRGGLCLDGTPGALEWFIREETIRAEQAAGELRLQWAKWRPKTEEQRIEASIEAWKSVMGSVMMDCSDSTSCWLSDGFSPLIRLGRQALPHLRRERAKAVNLDERGAWDYFIAAITGETDDKTVRELLNGSKSKKRLTCEIIAVTGQTQWAGDLEQIAAGFGSVSEKAMFALVSCLGTRAIPYLERLNKAPKDYETKYALAELNARLQHGDPRRGHGYLGR